MLKSHAFPCSSTVVRSRAKPGIIPNSGNIFAIAVTLGGLYTSESAQPARCFCFNTYFFLLPPKRSTRFRILCSTLQSPPGSNKPMSLQSCDRSDVISASGPGCASMSSSSDSLSTAMSGRPSYSSSEVGHFISSWSSSTAASGAACALSLGVTGFSAATFSVTISGSSRAVLLASLCSARTSRRRPSAELL